MNPFRSFTPSYTTLRDTPVAILQHFQCSICTDVLEEPVTTACGHTFCKRCLDRHMAMNDLVCSLCKQHLRLKPQVNIAFRDILKDFYEAQSSSPDEFTGQPEEVPCDVCPDSRKYKAVKSCLMCLLSYCNQHLKRHHNKLHSKGHKLVEPLNELDQRACMIHSRPLELYSVSEGKLICSLCVKGRTNVVSVEEERDRRQPNVLCTCFVITVTTIYLLIYFLTCLIETARIKKYGVDVTLDPDTANAQLLISDDMRQVHSSVEKMDVSDCPERFDVFGNVLGQNPLAEGRAFWVVEVGNKRGWDIEVAREKANRKGALSLKPSQGYWAIVHYNNDSYAALEDLPTLLALSNKPCKVGVFVDHSEKLVSFYDMEAETHIYSFTDCAFGAAIKPYFSHHLNENDPFFPLSIPVNNIPI
ncbi:ret finger protein-like 4A [Ictalurus punctatus]|uniref:Ret finger protein-like 4A n=1 Tax=Ictalurus punctatus TaxID=7998 RepID=A0A2D0QFR3_ICTPU|nr:ret finger protein-like 4A [Ictalurus punctatus]